MAVRQRNSPETEGLRQEEQRAGQGPGQLPSPKPEKWVQSQGLALAPAGPVGVPGRKGGAAACLYSRCQVTGPGDL